MIVKSSTLIFLAPVLFFCLVPESGKAQNEYFEILFYNVENLFDTIDDPLIDDSEFMPHGRYQWTGERYHTKVVQLARVISGDGRSGLPEILGICEVENRKVLGDLVASPLLKGAGYEIVHYDSPDERGIDVALLYQPSALRVLYSRPLNVTLPWDLDFRTRDILYVQGVTGTDTVHLYINHWPSRRGGMEASEPARMRAAQVLRSHLDSVAVHFQKFHVVIMGDLNDEPVNRSVKEVLKASAPGEECIPAGYTCLFDLSETIPPGEGTYYYWREKKWNILDHIIVSSSLFNTSTRPKVKEAGVVVLREPWMLKEEDGRMIPSGTFAKDYEGGFSDHLPVKVTLELQGVDHKKGKPRKNRKK